MSFLRSRMTCIISLIGWWSSLRSQILFMSKRCPTCVCSCFESFNICLVIVIGLAAMANMLNGWKNDATCNKLNIQLFTQPCSSHMSHLCVVGVKQSYLTNDICSYDSFESAVGGVVVYTDRITVSMSTSSRQFIILCGRHAR